MPILSGCLKCLLPSSLSSCFLERRNFQRRRPTGWLKCLPTG